MKFCIILGTRPEIIKMSPIVMALKKAGADFFMIHSGQHYSFNLDQLFFDDLGLPIPKYHLEVGSGLHGEQTSRILEQVEKVLISEKPDIVLVQGDTNTVLAGGLAAAKLHIKVAHIEAGLRSKDRSMPEEINRILVDHLADYLFAPTEKQKNILLQEGINESKIFVVGNTIVDAVLAFKEKESSILTTLGLSHKSYIFVTAHRQENVDVAKNFQGIISGFSLAAKKFNKKVIFAIHPRAKKMLHTFAITIPEEIIVIDPFGYLDSLKLQANAALIMTDSGGIQEEACILGVPCVTLRENTERPETIEVGGNILAGTNPEQIISKSEKIINASRNWINPFGDGNTGQKIIEILLVNKVKL